MSAKIEAKGSFAGWLFSRRNLRRGLLALGIVATATALFYTEENWRGRRAWERFEQESAARGMPASWEALIPPPVPDDQNFFKAPNMQAWFVGRGSTDLSRRVDYARLDAWMLRSGLAPAADVTLVSADAAVAPGDADLVLQYDPPLLTLVSPQPDPESKPVPRMKQKHVEMDPAVVAQMFKVIPPKVDAQGQEKFSPKVSNVNNRPIGLKPLPVVAPLRVVVRTDSHPSGDEIKEFLPAKFTGGSAFGYGQGIVTNGPNSYRVSLGSLPYAPAGDFLAWSDALQSDFEAMDAALQRPYARAEGDYEHPASIPIPNFVCARLVAQLLALRTQCHLLQGEPEKALHELTVMHHMSRMFEARPTSQPMTLVAAMINVAVKGLYVQIVGDGLRLNSWQEPQLMALQQQLAETDLMPYVDKAFRQGAMSFGQTVQTATSREIADDFYTGQGKTFWAKMSQPVYLFCRFMPHGWLYQNAIAIGSPYQKTTEGFDLANGLVLPRKVEAQALETEAQVTNATPYNYLETMYVANFSRAIQTLAKNQTLVNEAFIVCGLERYRLARGQYPDTLDALVPQYAEKLPHDLFGGGALKYRKDGDKFVLYSIGWNETDEGGVPSWRSDGKGDITQNDWVWPYQDEPEPAK